MVYELATVVSLARIGPQCSARHCYDGALLVIVETEQERQHDDHT